MKHKTKLKCTQNVALYNPSDLNSAQLSIEIFDASADVSNAQTAQYCHSELGNTSFSAHITTVEYQHVIAITSLFPKLILQHS